LIVYNYYFTARQLFIVIRLLQLGVQAQKQHFCLLFAKDTLFDLIIVTYTIFSLYFRGLVFLVDLKVFY